MHKCYFTVKTTCQGNLVYREEHLTLLQALWRLYKQVRRKGKYGIMRFNLEGY